MKQEKQQKENRRLLIVMGSMSRGGAERVISHISEYFVQKGWQVKIALLLSNRVDYELAEGVEIVDLTGNTLSRWKRLPGWLKGLRRLGKEFHPDTVLSFVARINVITYIALWGLGLKLVVSERNDPFSDGRPKYVDILTAIQYPKVHAVVYQTRRSLNYFKNPGRAEIIPNPVAVKCTADEPKTGRIVSVGRLTKQKNQTMLIRAFAKVKKEFPEAELTVYGEGELRESLTELAESLGVGDAVHLPGNILDLHEQIKDASVFALSSDYEGLSNALLEAMMMGLPVVSTDCAGSDEYIENGKNGLLTPVGDEDAMAEAIKTMLRDPSAARKMGEEGAKTAQPLQKDIIMEKWYEVLTEEEQK